MPDDWIEEFVDATEGLRSPKLFRLWTAITTVAAVLERRVWCVTDAPTPMRPNLYVILTGTPAAGKGLSISMARELLGNIDGLYLGPDNPTRRTLLNSIQNARRIPDISMLEPYCAMTMLVPEFGVLMSKYDKETISDLTHIWDNPKKYTAPRQGSEDVDIDAPTLNILAGATPDTLNDIIPEVAWGQGMTSRFVFIYGTPPNSKRNILKKTIQDSRITGLGVRLNEFFHELIGEMDWEDAANEAMYVWYNDKREGDQPTYSRLVHYCGRREAYMLKLSMISSVSAGNGMSITLSDFERAHKWLLEAEEKMPDVFRAMSLKSDSQLIRDCHYFLYTRFNSVADAKRVPIEEQEIARWYEVRAPSEKINTLIKSMELTGRITKKPGFGNLFIVNPLPAEDGYGST